MPTRQDEMRAQSLNDPETFWADAAANIDWSRPYTRVLARNLDEPPGYRWFPDGVINTCHNALDRHIDAGRGDDVALIYDSATTGTTKHFTFRHLRDEVARFAGVLATLGVEKGDRVIIYMPMVPEATVAMLACARLGLTHSVVFGGFAPKELAVRIDDAKPVVVVAGSCGIEGQRVIPYKPLLDAALEIATHEPDHCVIFQRPQGRADLHTPRDVDWHQMMADATPHDCVPVAATDPLYILYTSGTTGQPKGVVRDNGGHAVALAWSMQAIYDVRPGDVYWAASDIGWAVGHSYIVYGPLLAGITTVLYEGKPVGTPDAGAFWRVIADHRVNVLFTAPTAFRAIKKEDPNGVLPSAYDLSMFRALFLAGERCDPDTLAWAEATLGVPVIDHWWQTETGWSICANCLGVESLPVKPGSAAKPAPGWDLRVVDDHGQEVEAGTIGSLVAKLPLPPGTFPTLWNARQRFVDSYFTTFPGFYETADAGFIDEDGYVFVMARTDDIINVSGHRLSTGAMEEVLAAHPDIAECAVTGIADALKGQVPLGLLVLKAGVTRDHATIIAETVQAVRRDIGPIACFKTAVVVERLPKTRSGKILRKTVQKMADGVPFDLPATIDDPAILDEIRDALAGIGLPNR